MSEQKTLQLQDEDTSQLMCSQMPSSQEFANVLYKAQEAGKFYEKDFQKSQDASRLAWLEMYGVMARCIARGMRLQREQSEEKRHE